MDSIKKKVSQSSTPQSKQEEPTPSKTESEPGRFVPKDQAVAQSVFHEKFGWLERRLNQSDQFMGLITAVLFIGFITLLLAVVSILIQWWNFNANIQSDLIKSTKTQNVLLEKMSVDQQKTKELLKKLQPSPIPTNSATE